MLKMMNRKLRKSRAVAAMEDDISAERRLDRSPALTAAPRLRFPFFCFLFFTSPFFVYITSFCDSKFVRLLFIRALPSE